MESVPEKIQRRPVRPWSIETASAAPDAAPCGAVEKTVTDDDPMVLGPTGIVNVRPRKSKTN